jgi:lactate dehydrogenase-like 2-hydroxyacid dehydrogenase
MARCFVTRELPGPALDRLRAEHEVEVWGEPAPPPREALRAGAVDAEGLLALLTDPVDVEAATAREIPVGHTPGVLTDSTADLAVALMLAVARRLSEGERIVRAGEWGTWDPASFLGRDLHGATVAIVGGGRIGRAVGRRLEGFDCELLYVGRDDPLDPALEAADFVTVHAPLTDETRGMIGEAELRRMKPTAFLVNTARGPIVDAAALEHALREEWIAGAALDVTDPEPLPADHPLLGASHLLVIPHLGSATHRTREAMADLAVDNLLAGLAGERLPHCVNPEVYDGGARPS